jgi:predicted secreted protein
MIKYHTLAWLLCFSLSSAFANDVAQLDFLGFSRDAKYIAFEQYGSTPSGVYSELYFVDVADNSWAEKPLILNAEGDDSELNALRQKNRAAARNLFSRFGITGTLTGTHLISHTLHDVNAPTNTVTFTPDYPLGAYDRFDLILAQRPTTTDCGELGKAQIFTLSLIDQGSGKETILQKDTRLPSSRGCILNYRIQDVYLKNDALAVFLNLFSPSIEGQAIRYLVVTGEVK